MEAGRERWRAAGLPWSTSAAVVTPSSYPVREFDRATPVSREDVAALADDPDALIVDVRSRAEFEGGRFWPSGAGEGAGRPGRIPGAIQLPVDLVREDAPALRRFGGSPPGERSSPTGPSSRTARSAIGRARSGSR